MLPARPALALLLLAAPGAAHAGWVQAPGAYYVKLWDRSLVGARAFGLAGEAAELGKGYHDHAFNLYAEYGATPELTVVLRARPLGYAALGESSTLYSGLSELGLRYALLSGPLPLSAQLDYGYAPPLTPLAQGTVEGVPYVFRPTLSEHRFTATLAAGVAAGPWWARAEARAILSSGEGVDPALEATLGSGISTTFGLTAQLYAVLHSAVRDPRVIDVTGVGNTRYLGLGLELGYWLTDHFGLSAGFGTAAFAESNAATPALSFGMEIRS